MLEENIQNKASLFTCYQ